MSPTKAAFFSLIDGAYMEITEVKIIPVDEGRLRAYVSITFDHCFVISELTVS